MRRDNAVKLKNNSLNKKIVIALFSLFVGLLLFIFLLRFEAVSLEAYQTRQVVIAKQDIASGEKVNKAEIKRYFRTVYVNEDCAVDGFSSIEELENYIDRKGSILFSENVKEKEIIYVEKFLSVDEMTMQFENPVEVGVKVNSYEYCVGGTLRTGDIVDLSIVNLDVGSEILLEDILIIKAFDVNGSEILPDDKQSVSVGFNIMMRKQDFETYNSALENGKIRITKKFG